LTFSGNGSGAGTLIKQAAGNLILSGTGNSLTGATQIGNGTLTVNSGSSMGTGNLTFAQTATNATTVTLKQCFSNHQLLSVVHGQLPLAPLISR
jgi:autotransporter-associated beta strand protein